MKFSESQCKVCVLAIRCLTSATAALLHKDPQGQPLMDKASALLHRVGSHGENLAAIDPEQVGLLRRALNVTHMIYVLSKTLPTPESDRQHTLRLLRQCMSILE